MHNQDQPQKLSLWFFIALIIIVLDQITKYLATTHLSYAQPVTILPIFDLTLLHNKGAAFSFLSNAGGWQKWFFSGVAAIASVLLAVWLYRLPKSNWCLSIAFSFILAGAIGNLIDRLRFSYVVDFLSFHYNQHYFPAFNIADTAITIGAAFLLLDAFVIKSSEKTT